MKSTKIDMTIQKSLQHVCEQYPLLIPIITTISESGGRALLVGGAVRDLLMHKNVKDIDIEVHGLTVKQVEDILRRYGPVSLVGKQFGVFRLHGLDVDWSLPRSDESGRKPQVTIDPYLTFEAAFRRRDLTINAMGIDLQTHELIDPFGGQQDLAKKILRTPDKDFFIQDPLRFYRVMQFMGRFEMTPDEQLSQVCATMDIAGVSVERIEKEFEKLFLRSNRPSLGIRWLRTINRLQEILPELAATIGVEQEPSYHPEGDVFEHSMQALDAAAQLQGCEQGKKLILMFAALCHDLGKVSTTKLVDGKIISHGHAEVGARLAKKLLKRITRTKDLIMAVVKLVHSHMQPIQMIRAGAKPPAYKRLARKLAPEVTLAMLANLVRCDQLGRNPKSHDPLSGDLPELDEFLSKAEKANVLVSIEKPVLMGKDLLDCVQPGPEMGRLLKKAYQLQISKSITDKDELKRLVLAKK